MKDALLKKENIDQLIGSVIGRGVRFIAPTTSARQVVYAPIDNSEDLVTEHVLPVNSYKDLAFAQTEVVARFEVRGGGVDLEGVEIDPVETVVFGARPCEAASRASLGSVFTWDFIDEFYTKREERMTVVTVGCTKGDAECFCTTVGLSPESTEGSDVYMRTTRDGGYLATAITDRGRAFMEAHAGVFDKPAEADKPADLFMPEPIEGADLAKIATALKDREVYEDPAWETLARKCIGCGACTFSCPTCHCFDITDEGTAFAGERRKNWDACQFDTFTLHASGHNPRDTQYKRWRNRFMCKFHIYPTKFGSKGCVGCGRCIRVCPVRLDITDAMLEFSR